MRRMLSTPMRAATKIGVGTDLLVAMMACGRNLYSTTNDWRYIRDICREIIKRYLLVYQNS
jgi:hypothetical protein